RIGFRHGTFHGLQFVLGRLGVWAERIILHDTRVGGGGLVLGPVAHPIVGIAEHPQRFVGHAEQGILIHHAGQAIGRGRHGALVVVEDGGGVLVGRQNFLHIAQLLLGLGRELTIGILHQQLAALVLGADGVEGVAIRFVHLFVMDIANPFLGLGGFLHVGIEQLEVLVFGFGLRQTMRAAFAEPTVGDGQLGLGQELA